MALIQCAHCQQFREESVPQCLKCGHETIKSQNTHTGRTILGRYRVKQFLGGGLNGLVYAAEMIAPDKMPVVLKFMHHHQQGKVDVIEQFMNEARALQRLTHKNTIRCLDACFDPETKDLFLCLEFYQGSDLGALLGRRKLQIAESLHIVLVLADVLTEAHGKNIIHKDIKPSNILVREGSGSHPEQPQTSQRVTSLTGGNPALQAREILNEPLEWDFFLAYARADRSRAENLYAALSTSHRVFLDAHSVPPGDDWPRTISRALAATRLTIILISANSEGGHYLRDEISTAIQLARKDDKRRRVIPVFLDGLPSNVTAIPYGLGSIQGLDARKLGMEGIAVELRKVAARQGTGSELEHSQANQVVTSTAIGDEVSQAHQTSSPAQDENHTLREGRSLIDLKLIDFGISHFVMDPRRAEDVVALTPAYVAPEQVLGQAIDGRADIYSLGVLLFELLTGKVPFTGTPKEIVAAQINSLLPRLNESMPDSVICSELDMLIQKATAKDPKERFQSAPEMAEAIRNAAHILGIDRIGPEYIDDSLPDAKSTLMFGTASKAIDSGGESLEGDADITVALLRGDTALVFKLEDGTFLRADVVHLGVGESKDWMVMPRLTIQIQREPVAKLRLSEGWYFVSAAVGRTRTLVVPSNGAKNARAQRLGFRSNLYVEVNTGSQDGSVRVFNVRPGIRFSVTSSLNVAVIAVQSPQINHVAIAHFVSRQ